jgi:radical SAM protein with 4Fe4S-binding SPASM domain
MYLKYKFIELKFFIRALSWKRAFSIVAGYISGKLSQLTSHPIVWGLPFACSIEPTTRCNLRCPECPTGLGLIKREKGDMSLADFKKSLHSIASHTSYLTLYLQGEPFLNKDLSSMIKFASRLKVFTCLSTNGHFLNTTNSEDIISAGLHKIIISLDGTSQNSYGQYRRNGSFEKVTEGIKTLVETKKKSKAANPLIVIQFIVFRTNEHEIDDIKKLGKTLGADKVEIKTAQHYDLPGGNNLITSIDKYNRYRKNEKGNWELKSVSKKGCSRLWTTAVITWDGKLTACCYDKDAEFTFGNMDRDNFKSIWKSEKFMNFRRTVLKDRKSIAMCNNCGEK